MTALDADTLRNLRNLLAKMNATPVGFGLMDVQDDVWEAAWPLLPALLDAAEAVERIRTLADTMRCDCDPGPDGYPHRAWCRSFFAAELRAALAPPHDKATP